MSDNTAVRAAKLDKIFGTPVCAVLLAIFCNVLWGSAFPFIKLGYRLFSIDSGNTASIFCFAGVRFMLGSVLVLLGSILLQGKAPRLPRGRVAAECCALGLVADHGTVCVLLYRCCHAHRRVWRHLKQHPELSGRHLCPLYLRQCGPHDPGKNAGLRCGFCRNAYRYDWQPRQRQRLGVFYDGRRPSSSLCPPVEQSVNGAAPTALPVRAS